MSKRRLCFIVESGSDVRLVEGLAERFELTVLARRIVGGVEISHGAANGCGFDLTVEMESRVGFARLVWRTLRARRGEIDFVLVQGYGLAALAANLAGRIFDLRVRMLVCSPVERYYLCRRQHAEASKPFRWWELFALGLLARANAVVGQGYFVLSRYLAEVVRGHGGRRPVECVPLYGVDTEIFSPLTRESKRTLRERLGLPLTGALIFFSSRVAPEKDAETLLAAVRTLVRRGHDIRVLHRSGGHRAFLEAARRFGVAERVFAADAVHPHRELPDAYRASDLCVQASREEGLGFSPLESLACMTPVVAADVGGLKETIIDGETGWSYPVGDAERLAQAIEEALGNPAEAQRRAAAGRRLVCAQYERRAVFNQLVEMLCADDGRVENANDAQRRLAPATTHQAPALREETDSL
jgi:glycosyltransferase involved in cell wall biosynthesis